MGVACARGAPAVARDRALHRDHPGDGRRRARARGRAARAGAADARARPGGPQRLVRPAGPAPGLRALRPGVARSARDLHRGAGAPLCAPGAPARAGLARRRARNRGRGGPPRPAGRPHVRAGAVRAVPQAVHALGHRPRRRGGARPEPQPQAGPAPRGPAPPAVGPARPLPSSGRPRRVRVPRRARAAPVRGQVGVAAHAGAVALLRARGLDGEGGGRGLPPHELRAGGPGAGEPPD